MTGTPTYDEALSMLTGWRSVMDERDPMVRAAHAAGVSKQEIYRRTGIARSTIDRILTGRPDG